MFSYITKKLTKNVCTVIALILFIYFLSIFFVYSLFLRNDFAEKSQNIGQKISRHLTIQCENVEKVLENSIQNTTLSQMNYTEISTLLKNCLSSNINIDSVFFFNETMHYYHPSSQRVFLDPYITSLQNQYHTLSDKQWDIFMTADGISLLLYRYKITFSNNESGYLVVVPDIDAYLKNADIYNNDFIQNAAMFLGNSEGSFYNLYVPETSHMQFAFSEELTQQTISEHLLNYTVNYMLNETIYLKICFSFYDVLKSSLPMLYFFFAEFLLVLGICFLSIRRYTQFLDGTLTALTKKVEHTAKNMPVAASYKSLETENSHRKEKTQQ